jgi:hypothetical protein
MSSLDQAIMKIMSKFGLASTLLTFFFFVNIAAANTVGGDVQDQSFDDWIVTIPADLSGFFELGKNPFPLETSPGLPWTDPNNIATLNYWMSLISELGDNPSLLPDLYGLGMNDGSGGSTSPTVDVSATSLSSLSSTDVASTPEPVTGALLGAGLIPMAGYAWRSSRTVKPQRINS